MVIGNGTNEQMEKSGRLCYNNKMIEIYNVEENKWNIHQILFNPKAQIKYEYFASIHMGSNETQEEYLIFATPAHNDPSIEGKPTEIYDLIYDNEKAGFSILPSKRLDKPIMRERRAVSHNVFHLNDKIFVFGGTSNPLSSGEYLDLCPPPG